jgi:hypothetical protein
MMAKFSLPGYIEDDIREFIVENRRDAKTAEEVQLIIDNSTAIELLDMYLTWNGIIGWTDRLLLAVDGIRSYIGPQPKKLRMFPGRPSSPLKVGAYVADDHFRLKWYCVVGFSAPRSVVLQPVYEDGTDNGTDLRIETTTLVFNCFHGAEAV